MSLLPRQSEGARVRRAGDLGFGLAQVAGN
jgi:hypothetical protein